MNYEEVIQAWEKVLAMGDAPIGEHWGCWITTKLAKETFDMLNRQKAEIERLQKANKSFSCLGMLYSEIKSEARKEFWEQIKEMYGLDENDIIVAVNIKDIDNLLAKMDGGKAE